MSEQDSSDLAVAYSGGVQARDVEINNFLGLSPIELSFAFQETIGPLVRICQRGGALSFQHDMKPEQAREMASALLTCANKADALGAQP